MNRKTITIILAMIIVSLLHAQDQGNMLEGVVREAETNQPLSGAHVQIEGTFYRSITNSSGRFHISNLKTGNYILKVSYLGFRTRYENFTIPGNISLDIALQPEAITTEEIIITAIRADERTPGTHQTISGEKIRSIATGQDLPLLLELTPSLVTTSDAGAGIGYTGLRIRGTDISRINVTINGVPLNDPESHSVYWVNLPDLAGSTDNIQIQRGVGTSANGAAAFGASINIQTTKLVAEPFAELNSYAGSFNSFSNNVLFGTGLLNGGWAFDGRLSRITSDGYIDRAFSDLNSFFLNAGHFGEKNIFRLTITGGSEKTYQAWGGVPKDSLKTNRTFNPYTYENETDNYGQQHFHLNFMRQQNRHLSFNATAFLVKGNGYYEQYKENRRYTSYGLNPVIIGIDTIKRTDLIQQKHLDNIFYGLNISSSYHSMKKLRLTGGGSVNRYTNDHFGKVIWMQYAAEIPKDYQWYFNNGIKTDASGFLKGNYLLTDRFSFFSDVLYRHISYSIKGKHDDLRDLTQSHTYDFINPKGGIFYVIDNRHECYASVATAKREPSRNNFRDADENTVPKPELLIDYEAGYNFKLKYIMLNANVFYMDYKDQLVMTGKINNVGDPVMINVPESYRAGIELILSARLHEKIEIDGNISLSRNRIRDFTEWVDNWDTGEQVSQFLGDTDISFSPSIVSGAEIRYQPLERLHLAMTSKFVSRQYIDNTSSEERMLNPWHVSNFRIAVNLPLQFVKSAQLRFQVYNVLNVKYESNAWVYRYYYEGREQLMDGYFPQAGRHFMAGLNVRF